MTKDEVFNKFTEFKALVENQTWRKIKVLRSDNGGKYTSTKYQYLSKEAQTNKELTIPYNPL
jgi:transposase InsO family protein